MLPSKSSKEVFGLRDNGRWTASLHESAWGAMPAGFVLIAFMRVPDRQSLLADSSVLPSANAGSR